MTNQKKAYIFALSAILFWSTAAAAFKIALRYVDYVQLLLFASLTTVVILTIVLVFQGNLKSLIKQSARDLFNSMILGFLNPFLYYMVLLKAYSVLPAQIAQPLNYTWPIMLVILSVPLLKQPLTLKSFIAILISFSGVFVISTRGKISFDIENPFGVFLAVGSSLIWALFWILNVRDKRNEIVKLFFNFVFGTVFILIAIWIMPDTHIGYSDIKGLYAAIYVGFFEMGITFVLWLKALQLTESNDKISNLVYLSPFLALIFIRYIVGEEIYLTTPVGLVLIVTGIVIQQIKRNKKSLKKTET